MARRDFAEHYAKEAFNEIFGREPSSIELAQVVPVFMGADPNIHNIEGGRAAVAALAQAEQNDPRKLDEKRRKELEGKAPEFYGGVDQSFQSTFGRTATDQERKHFGTLLASGDVDEYTLGQWLQQLPENVKKQDEQFRKEIGTELQGQDSQYYKEQVLPAIQSSFAQQGRSVESSGYATALAQAAQQQNRQREGFLSNLSASQYGGRSGAAREDYLTNI